jgi:hypothetical protein
MLKDEGDMAKNFTAAVFGLSFGLSASAALAAEPIATLTEFEGKGKISVNQGEGFAPAVEGMRLKPGDRVMAYDDSSAELKFDDCETETEVHENSIVTVPDKTTCNGGVPLVQSLTPTGSGAIGSTGAGKGGLIFAAWAVGAVIACSQLCEEDDDDTVSP